jgi:N-acetylneuraminate synthase/N,N'-diacetyllegionaminate synthase
MINQGVIIIAEAGVNHNGSILLAKQLIDVATEAGVDYIKFQTYVTELNISKIAKKAAYQIKSTQIENETQFEMVKKLELSFEDFIELQKYCNIKNIGFLSTGFDFQSVDFLDKLGQNYFKIPSGEITNKPYLQHIASKGKPIILSTGMATLFEIETAILVMLDKGITREMITVLHCNTEYPTPMQDVNLKAMLTIGQAFGVQFGYSDHTMGIEIPIAAVALGAKIIEKHFTLDRKLPGPDHKASLEPHELIAMVNAIRNVEKAISGNGLKEPSVSEMPNIAIARKSIHLKIGLTSGTLIKSEHLVMKRPGDGISPMNIDKVIGKTLIIDAPEDYKLNWEDIQ